MPGHIHAGPQCTEMTGRPCNAGGARCSHRACLNGGPLLGCQKTRTGDYFCFHREYYLGPDAVNDAEAARLQRELSPAPVPRVAPPPPPPAPVNDPIGDLVRDFSRRAGRGAFPRVPRETIARELLIRARDASTVNQGKTWMCGPAAFMYAFAKDHPLEYVRFVIELYETGESRIGTMKVTPSLGFRNDFVAPGSPAIDWITLGSLRDSTNAMFEYHYNSGIERLRGGTRAGNVLAWFKGAGYQDVQDWTDGSGQAMNARLANQYLARGYKVCLKIDADLLGGDKELDSLSIFPNHYVILTSPIDIKDDGVTFTVYTWRTEKWRVPQVHGRIPLATFLGKYYGFIAGKP